MVEMTHRVIPVQRDAGLPVWKNLVHIVPQSDLVTHTDVACLTEPEGQQVSRVVEQNVLPDTQCILPATEVHETV